ncbi:MAG: cytochrome c family protein [Rhodospirillales bacterium]|nr:cytochrome c family protein [Rhodospirillales bacterium]MCB9996134.1 cytochrome c family protein [Rhodospirillales bacterium]
MSGMELNKIFAALLVAGIVASFSGFIAKEITHPHELEENAVKIEGVGEDVGGPAKKAGPEPVLALIAAADPARGQQISKACAACHSFDKGGPNGTGPNLWGIVARDKASHAGFSYSEAMAAEAGNWDYVELNKFLWKPKAVVPGTKMNYIGIKKPEDRAAMIAWLRTLSDSPKALPSDAAIAAEQAELGAEEAAEAVKEAAGEAVGAAQEAVEDVKDAIEDAVEDAKEALPDAESL